MSRRAPKVVLTIAVLLGALAMAVLRTHQWRLPAPFNAWITFRSNRITANPEDAIYSMLDAARAGDVKAYLDCFSGLVRDQRSWRRSRGGFDGRGPPNQEWSGRRARVHHEANRGVGM